MGEETFCSASRNSMKKLLEACSGKKLRSKKKLDSDFNCWIQAVGFYALKEKQIHCLGPDLSLTSDHSAIDMTTTVGRHFIYRVKSQNLKMFIPRNPKPIS